MLNLGGEGDGIAGTLRVVVAGGFCARNVGFVAGDALAALL